jgi:hypothetical protein
MIEDGFEIGTDWGDFQTFTTYALPLPGGGLYFFDELVQPHTNRSARRGRSCAMIPATFSIGKGRRFRRSRRRADSAPAGTNSTFVAVLEAAWDDPELRDRIPEQHVRVAFSVYKEGGGERKGVNTVAYLKWLFNNSAERCSGGR